MQRAGICLETKVACRAAEQQANSVPSKWQKRKRSRSSGRSCTARQLGGIEGGLKVLHGKPVKCALRVSSLDFSVLGYCGGAAVHRKPEPVRYSAASVASYVGGGPGGGPPSEARESDAGCLCQRRNLIQPELMWVMFLRSEPALQGRVSPNSLRLQPKGHYAVVRFQNGASAPNVAGRYDTFLTQIGFNLGNVARTIRMLWCR